MAKAAAKAAAKPEKKGQVDRDKQLTSAYGEATSKLRDENRDRFNELYQEAAAARGIEWKPKPSAVEKARATISDLLSEHTELRDDPRLRALFVDEQDDEDEDEPDGEPADEDGEEDSDSEEDGSEEEGSSSDDEVAPVG